MLRSIITLIFILLFAASSFACGGETETAVVDAKGGLRMRSEPNTSANRITTIPDKESVEILVESSGNEIELAGRKGKWTQVKYKDDKGWVFGGFLIRPGDSPQQSNQVMNEVAVNDFEPLAPGLKLSVKSSLQGDADAFWIKIETSQTFSGKCAGYTEYANLAGTWKQINSEVIELTGSADVESCADGPAPEDGSSQCHTETRQFKGRIDIKHDGERQYVAAYRSLPDNNETTPCGGNISDGMHDYL